MSRIGKVPVEITQGVNVSLNGQKLEVSGTKGKLNMVLPDEVNAKVDGGKIVLNPANDSKSARAKWGLARSLVRNMVKGVSEGFTVKMEINGVGYRAAAQGKTLKLNLGYSHDVIYQIPAGVEAKTPKPTELELTSADKQLVGQVAAEIRKFRKPEPYKGKGIKYVGETIRRKEGKKK